MRFAEQFKWDQKYFVLYWVACYCTAKDSFETVNLMDVIHLLQRRIFKKTLVYSRRHPSGETNSHTSCDVVLNTRASRAPSAPSFMYAYYNLDMETTPLWNSLISSPLWARLLTTMRVHIGKKSTILQSGSQWTTCYSTSAILVLRNQYHRKPVTDNSHLQPAKKKSWRKLPVPSTVNSQRSNGEHSGMDQRQSIGEISERRCLHRLQRILKDCIHTLHSICCCTTRLEKNWIL